MAAPRVCQVQFLVAYLEEPGMEGLFLLKKKNKKKIQIALDLFQAVWLLLEK